MNQSLPCCERPRLALLALALTLLAVPSLAHANPVAHSDPVAHSNPVPPSNQATPSDQAAETDEPQAIFVDRGALSGVDFVHRFYGTGEKYMPENMGPGLAVFDADGDGRLDLFFPQGAPVSQPRTPSEGTELAGVHRLYLQQANGRFVGRDVRSKSSRTSGMGVAVGDVDRDGDLDLYLSAWGPDAFLRNRGDGTFEDATEAVGLGKTSWSTGATFFDPDGDGDLDLYVASYVDFALDHHEYCGSVARGLRSYCHPDVYGALPDAFYRNDGGRFVEVGPKVGMVHTEAGKGLGVIAGDVDGDGDQDLYVANDSAANYLYLGDGRGRFEESALFAGAALDGAGKAEASMGLELGDVDGDGLPELFATHLDQETNTLYRNRGQGLFADDSQRSGLGLPSLPWVGFGTALLDVDLDGDLDLAVVNGHILDNIALFAPERSHAQPPQLFLNEGGRFTEVPGAFAFEPGSAAVAGEAGAGEAGAGEAGDAQPVRLVGRGLVAADLDRDGDPDLVSTENGGPARVWLNRLRETERFAEAADHRSLTVRLVGKKSEIRGFGARLELRSSVEARAEGNENEPEDASPFPRQVREMRAASSYLSQGPPEVLFGVGPARSVPFLEVRWPSGRVDRYGPLATDGVWILGEGAAEAVRAPP